MHEQNLRGRSSTPQERLVNDQQRSRSAVVKKRWERWMDRRDAQGSTPAHGSAEAEGVMTTTPNLLQIAVVLVIAALVLARALL